MTEQKITTKDTSLVPIQLEFDIDIRSEPEKVVRPEYNIGKWAHLIFVNPWGADTRAPREYTHLTEYKGKKVDGTLTISPTIGYETPTTTTMKVFLGLMAIWEQQHGETVRRIRASKSTKEIRELDISKYKLVHFSTRQLCAQAGWVVSGKNCNDIRRHLDILSKTSIDWKAFLTVDDEILRLVKDMRIIQENNYLEQQSLLDSEQFTQNHAVLLNSFIVEGMVEGRVRPFNFETFRTIKNPSASAVYAQLDFRLSKSDHYSRNSHGLLIDDLKMTGDYLKYKSRRKARLQKIVDELNGKEIGVSDTNPAYLQLSISETVDGSDWKLEARKLTEKRLLGKPSKSTSSTKRYMKPIRRKVEAKEIAVNIYKRLKSHPKAGRITPDDFLGICLYTPDDILYTCLTDVITEYAHGNGVRKSLSAIYFHSVKQQMDKRSLPYPK